MTALAELDLTQFNHMYSIDPVESHCVHCGATRRDCIEHEIETGHPDAFCCEADSLDYFTDLEDDAHV